MPEPSSVERVQRAVREGRAAIILLGHLRECSALDLFYCNAVSMIPALVHNSVATLDSARRFECSQERGRVSSRRLPPYSQS